MAIIYRAAGSPALHTGRYQHSACTHTEIVAKGNILALCSNRSCPNKGANWVLQEDQTTDAPEGMKARPSSAAS